MIFIQQNKANLATLELTNNSSLWIYSSITPYFLFLFESDTTHQKIYFVGNNIAPFSSLTSYDQFIITETGSTYTNLSASTIYLSPGMFWTYSVWEQNTQYNFNPLLSVGLVDTGKIMFSAGTSNITYFQNSGTTNFITYTNY